MKLNKEKIVSQRDSNIIETMNNEFTKIQKVIYV